jgi:tetratricopeptide (TPR) repeat protein
LRAAVAEARRAADLQHRQGQAQEPATARGPAWPVEPGSLAEAVYWYRRLAGQRDHTQMEDIIAALSNLGYAWRTDRRWAEAETAFHEALQLCQQHGDRAGMRQAFFDLGSLYQAQQRWSDAEPALAQGLEIARETGDRRGEAHALGNLGVVYAALGQADQARTCIQQAVVVAQQISDESLVRRMLERLARFSQC